MATATEFLARGKVTGTRDGIVIFAPAGTNYELHLVSPTYSGAIGVPVDGIIRAQARKLWTVPSGGLFIAPIFGTPRTIQGRIRSMDGSSLVVHAGTPIYVELPTEEHAIDLPDGAMQVGQMINIVALPGASFELR